MPQSDEEPLDCLIIGGGPAGLTAALYLARFGRQFMLVDSGASRAAWIPASHNFPVFSDGVSGPDMLARQREHLARYGLAPVPGMITNLQKEPAGNCPFSAEVIEDSGEMRTIRAKRVLLATGAVDTEPEVPALADAMQRGLVRYCPICDGYEARGRKVAVIGYGAHGLGEAVFIARTYSHDVTLLTLGQTLHLTEEAQRTLREHNIKLVADPIDHLEVEGDRIAAIRIGGHQHRFETLYAALGLNVRSTLATALGAEHDGDGALLVDGHNQTSVRGLYAAGDTVKGLNQIVVAMGHAAIAATDIHNRCEMPTDDE